MFSYSGNVLYFIDLYGNMTLFLKKTLDVILNFLYFFKYIRGSDRKHP